MEEEIRFWRPSHVPGVEAMDVKNSSRLFKLYHETYTICFAFNSPRKCGNLFYRGKDHMTPGSTCFLMQPGEIHYAKKMDEPVSSVTIFMKPETLHEIGTELLATPRPALKSFLPMDGDLDREFLASVSTLRRSRSPLEQQCALQGLLTSLVARYGEGTMGRIPDPGHRALGRARDLMVDCFSEELSLEDLARAAGLTKWHFLRSFRKAYGLTPHAFQIRVRVEKARQRLASGGTPGEFDVGFRGQSLLIKRFKETFGVTPGRYRRMLAAHPGSFGGIGPG